MIENGNVFIVCDGKKFDCVTVDYRAINGKWSFVIPGIESPIFHKSIIGFSNVKMIVGYTDRDLRDIYNKNMPVPATIITARVM